MTPYIHLFHKFLLMIVQITSTFYRIYIKTVWQNVSNFLYYKQH